MPAMANITVKNAANADVTLTAATPSAGDRSPAVWRGNAASAIIGNRPRFSVVTRDNSRKNGRVFVADIDFPILQTIGGVETSPAKLPLTLTGTLPNNVDAALVNDAFTQAVNFLASALIKSVAAEGYAPT